MAVLINGMEMSMHCIDCPFMVIRDNYDCILQSAESNESFENLEQMKAGCPLIPIPPHGRLIDAGKIGLTDFEIILCQKGNPFKNALEMLLEKIENAPTVIPTEEGE